MAKPQANSRYGVEFARMHVSNVVTCVRECPGHILLQHECIEITKQIELAAKMVVSDMHLFSRESAQPRQAGSFERLTFGAWPVKLR